MLRINLCWDENGRNVVIRRDARPREVWPIGVFPLGSAELDKGLLSADLVGQLAMFGSAELSAVDEGTIVPRLSPFDVSARHAA
ncbi:MAG TPA: hypothetical protein VFE72_09240 [Lysobacter sp.]|nr:hypothetical protein [Lysobacter sp.]